MSELGIGETLALFVLWPTRGLSSLGVSGLVGWVTTRSGEVSDLTQKWKKNPQNLYASHARELNTN